MRVELVYDGKRRGKTLMMEKLLNEVYQNKGKPIKVGYFCKKCGKYSTILYQGGSLDRIKCSYCETI